MMVLKINNVMRIETIGMGMAKLLFKYNARDKNEHYLKLNKETIEKLKKVLELL